MGDFFRDYGTPFVAAVAILNTIISLISGQLFKNNPGAECILVGASVVVSVIAVAATFYSQHQIVLMARTKKEQASEEIQRRLAMKDFLGRAIDDGESLLKKQRVESDDEANAYENDFNAWSDKVATLIESVYGSGEVRRFMNYAGIELYSSNRRTTLTASQMNARIQRLNELMPRVDTIVMRPDHRCNTNQNS
jgi:hypothetical protein